MKSFISLQMSYSVAIDLSQVLSEGRSSSTETLFVDETVGGTGGLMDSFRDRGRGVRANHGAEHAEQFQTRTFSRAFAMGAVTLECADILLSMQASIQTGIQASV